jgi:hypothetical protein
MRWGCARSDGEGSLWHGGPGQALPTTVESAKDIGKDTPGRHSDPRRIDGRTRTSRYAVRTDRFACPHRRLYVVGTRAGRNAPQPPLLAWGCLPRDGDRPFACLAHRPTTGPALAPETPRPACAGLLVIARPSPTLCPKQKVEKTLSEHARSRLGRSVGNPPRALAAPAYIKDRFCRRQPSFYSGSAV